MLSRLDPEAAQKEEAKAKASAASRKLDAILANKERDYDSEDDEEGNVREDPETKKMREGMMRGIERAAGGNLIELV